MSQITDFYTSWLGNASFGGNSIRLRGLEPVVIRPTDISDCVWWFDGNDNDSVVYNELLLVSAWKNKGTLGGQFDISGGVVEYGQTLVNGLNTLTFNENAYMSRNYALDFQPRSFFVVVKQTTVLGGQPNPIITSDTSGGAELFTQPNGTEVYFLGKHPSPFPELAAESSTVYTGNPVQLTFINATDLSDNIIAVNGTTLPLIYAAVASGYETSSISYFLGNYASGSPTPTTQEICEIILYGRALSIPDQQNIEKYLRIKWGIVEPTPTPPAPFIPTDIAGLYVWMDANNQSTITTDLSNNVLSWSNLGLASNVFSNDSNYAKYAQDSNSNYFVAMPTETTLATYTQLPYLTRTNFVVFENVSDLTTLTYPYENLFVANASAGVQMGVSYDSNTTKTFMAMCQSGINCPVGASISLPVGGYNLMIMASDSNTTANTLAYWNGGSNINTSTDLGNLFNTNPIPYVMGSPVFDSPSYRVGEILEYDSFLTTSNISTVANYLVTKWAISSFTVIT